ncbi:hypothetical protein P154DRAFT_418581 [Amniculicola lignicola CBS 123094]|uniref:SNF2 N-terminal domain-containing protein n=1 Tax=Amniculicola lignicola CBS 123094 TaxID=1392246 RepID=A0A6A5X4D8_9PLEO|nr:hypothetical protein P154DRAFT_418581 [Amniculicola lignicola CBS 123094]
MDTDNNEESEVVSLADLSISKTQYETSSRSRRSRTRVSYTEVVASSASELESGNESDASGSVFSAAAGIESADEEPEDVFQDGEDLNITDENSPISDDGEAVIEYEDVIGVSEQRPKASKRIPTKKANKYIDLSLPPLSDIDDIFSDLTEKALHLGLDSVVADLDRPLNVATSCSGTESPLWAIDKISEALKQKRLPPINYKHHFSAEIDPVKQAFIERNRQPAILFRDVREFFRPENTEYATTAYGAEVKIPDNIDLFIASFSCVDLSHLNRYPKEFEKGGETADTWYAIEAYAKNYQPSIILTENVVAKKVIWEKCMARLADVGYESTYLIADTKHYYLPQTRQRMYMIAINKKKLRTGSKNAIEEWKTLMDKLQRQCSSPFESFLISDQSERQAFNHATTESDWEMCKLRYDCIRSTERLGLKRPLTRWNENGTLNPPDIANRQFYLSQSSRIWDAIEVAHLQGAQAGYDSLYKMAVWDVSQNVERFRSTLGVLPAITPGGIDFVSNQHTALTGSQLLLLQGLPMNEMLFANETQKEQQDLAGNAMTTTVIGASILAALICGRNSFPNVSQKGNSEHDQRKYERRHVELFSTGQMQDYNMSTLDTTQLDLLEFTRDAMRSSRLCTCEGNKMVAKATIRRCQDCNHMVCTSCAGNPSHNYVDMLGPESARTSPSDFENKWRQRLPNRLTFQSAQLSKRLSRISEHQAFNEGVANAMNDSEFFSMRGFQRCKAHWKVVYHSMQATLQLRVGAEIQWYLFVNCEKNVAANDPMRTLFQHPVARGQVHATLMEPQWEVYLPHSETSKLTIAASTEQAGSWRSRIGLPDYKHERTPLQLDIQDPTSTLTGEYRLHQECGTAMASLYRRVAVNEGPMYLFLDPNPIGPSELDSFVFSHDCQPIKYGEARQILATLQPSWRPWGRPTNTEKVNSTNKGIWKGVDIALKADTTKIKVSMPSFSSIQTSSRGDCSKAITVLEVRVSTTLDLTSVTTYSWALERAKQLPFSDSWDQWADHTAVYPQDTCVCAPSPPSIRWLVGEKDTVTAREEPREAARFERATKTRPRIIVLEPSLVSGGTRIQIAVNFSSLVHRLRNRLPAIDSSIRTRCRLVAHKELAKPVIAKFRLRNNSKDLLYNASSLNLGYTLSEAQCRSLGWMRAQETGVTHTITEVEEEVHYALGWRAEAIAETDVIVRGGALADLPSFGKTVTTIGLIRSEFQNNTPEQIVKENCRRSAPAGVIEVATTLIVCPHHILKQWNEELRNCLGDVQYKKYNIKVIETTPQLRKLTAHDIKTSRVILLAWKVLASANYIADLAQFAAMPEPATLRSRYFDSWLDYLIQQVPARLRELQEKGIVDFQRDTAEVLEARMEEETFRAVVPSKRLKGAAYAAQKKKASTSKTPRKSTVTYKHDDSKTEWGSYPGVLQLFRFNRIVVDEYSYLLDKKEHYPAYVMLKKLPAHKKWILSGTPAISNFPEVNQIATLLGTTLGRDGFSSKDQTDVEKFLTRTEMMSPQWHQDRHARSQIFLDKFLRQNEPTLQHITCQESLRPVNLVLSHRVVYLELSQYLIEMKMEVKKLRSDKTSDRTERLNMSLEGCVTGEEALLKRALVRESEAEAEASVSGLAGLVEIRERQIRDIKQEIYKLMKQAESIPWAPEEPKNPEVYYTVFKMDVKTGNFHGEKDTCRELYQLLRKVEKNSTPQGKTTTKERITLLKHIVSDLRCRGQELTHRHRSLRFVGTLQGLIPILSSNGPIQHHPTCSSFDCSKPATLDSLFVISLCGHLACKSCLTTRPSNETCVVDDCNVTVQDQNLIKVSDLHSEGDGIEGTTSYGNKLSLICNTIKRIPKNEQAIVFAPNQDTVKVLQGIFCLYKISHHFIDASGGDDDGGKVEDFQKNRDPKTMKKLIILNLEDESAAGLNLVNANHVIFISPLLAKKQHDYDAKMAQAIARARRYKQERTVHVYHFVALRTIDVDILEHRHKRSNAIGESNTIKGLSANSRSSNAPLKKEKTRMVQLNSGEMALIPVSWLADKKQCKALGVNTEKLDKFTSLIGFSESYEDDDEE